MRSGIVTISSTISTFTNAGIRSYGWSSRGTATRYDGANIPSSYNLDFNATGVLPSNGPSNRYLGFPLRCLSTVLDI